MSKNKSGEVVIDQNIKIAIAVITLIVILIGVVYFFGGKIAVAVVNFLPQYNTQPGDKEIVLTGTDANVNYNFQDTGAFNPNSAKTVEEQNGLITKNYVEFYKNILTDFSILSYSRAGVEIIKLKTFVDNNIDPNPQTNPVRILFTSKGKTYVDFVYDAQKNQVFFGNSNTGVFIGKENSALIAAPMQLGSTYPEFANLNADDWKDIQSIVLSNSLESFMSKVVSVVDRQKAGFFGFGDQQYLYSSGDSLSTVPGVDATSKSNYIYNILTKNRPYYKSSWTSNGYFTKQENKNLIYSCNINAGWVDCTKQGSFFCKVGFTSDNDCLLLNNNYKQSDLVLYIKGSEIWGAEFDRSPQLSCYRGIVEGSRCN